MAVFEHSNVRLAENAPKHRSTQLDLNVVTCGGEHTLVLAGELDMTSCRVVHDALARISTAASAVVLDLRRLTFIDSSGVNAVLLTQELCKHQGWGFSLIAGAPQIQRVFEISGLLDHLPFRDDERLLDPDLSGEDSKAGATPDRLAPDDRPPRHLREPTSGSDSGPPWSRA